MWRETSKRLSKHRGVAAGAGALVLASGAPLLARVVIEAHAASYLWRDLGDVPPRRVAIVPGARVFPDGTPSAMLEDRLATAFDLYRARKVEKILVSGDHQAPEYDETNAMHQWLRQQGLPEDDLFLDHAGLRTLDTMERARRVFGIRSAVVCTQEFHLPRAVFLARRASIDAVGLVADRRHYQHLRSNRLREGLARLVAVLDSYVLKRAPRYPGDPIPITGSAGASHDPGTKK